MRIRSTKPEFWRSETIGALDWDCRLVLKGLESYVDDNGVGKDSVVLICADVFPHDLAKDSETVARVSRALQNLAEANLIVRYRFNGQAFIYVRRWKFIQRVDKPNQGRYPRPDGSLDYTDDVDESVMPGQDGNIVQKPASPRETSKNPREGFAKPPVTLAPGTEEQRNRGTGCGAHTDSTPSPFCDLHPNGTRKKCGDCGNARTAFRAWEKSQDAIDQQLVDAAEAERRRRRAAVDNCPDCDDFGRRDDLSLCPNHPSLKDPIEHQEAM